ncbi:MAG TPA: GatB/YqeY domain-containing protein [Firmicutes bacterium]|nr:GatB/YqeY domain-containing protein [Bacillota bacterium]
MSKIDVVRKAMMQALKDKDAPRKETLSLLLSALKNKAIDKRADLTEEEENAVVLREIKQTQETMDLSPADRTELIQECQARIAVLSEFAPPMMDEAAVRAEIDEVLAELGIGAPTPRDKGAVMKSLMPRVKGKADGSLVARLVGERLG